MVDTRLHPICPWRTLLRRAWFLPPGSTETAVKPASSPPDDKTVLRKAFSTACDMLQDWLWKTPLCDLVWRIVCLLSFESAYISYTQWCVLLWHLHACTSFDHIHLYPPLLSSFLSDPSSSQLVTLPLFHCDPVIFIKVVYRSVWLCHWPYHWTIPLISTICST